MENSQAIGGQGIQPGAQALLTDRASIPGLGVWPLAREGDCNAS
ncbi:hypothetical protein [Arthrobacter sp. 135MFCol5.1]|nr:hypothetical protein [Arthrobacter sp. 135MFCol5.1]